MLPAAGLGSRGCLYLTPPSLPASLPFLPGEGMAGLLPEVLLQGHSGGCLRSPFIPNLTSSGLNDRSVACLLPEQAASGSSPVLWETQSSHELLFPFL